MTKLRKRPISFHLRLTDEENEWLREQAWKSGLKPQAYILAVMKGYQLKERPSMDLISILKSLQQISNNLNQIAMRANNMNFIDTEAYWNNVDSLEDVKRNLLEVMYG